MFFPTFLLFSLFIRTFDTIGTWNISANLFPFFIVLQLLCYVGIIISINIKSDMPNLSYLTAGEKVIYMLMILTTSPILLPVEWMADKISPNGPEE
jgi:hypothetical protein